MEKDLLFASIMDMSTAQWQVPRQSLFYLVLHMFKIVNIVCFILSLSGIILVLCSLSISPTQL